MKLRFLCPARRRWLLRDAEATSHTLQQMQEIARLAMLCGDAEKATRFAGSALECGELLLLSHRRVDATCIADFRRSAELLGSALEMSGSRSLVCQVMCGSIATLQDLGAVGEEAAQVYDACRALLSRLHHGIAQRDRRPAPAATQQRQCIGRQS